MLPGKGEEKNHTGASPFEKMVLASMVVLFLHVLVCRSAAISSRPARCEVSSSQLLPSSEFSCSCPAVRPRSPDAIFPLLCCVRMSCLRPPVRLFLLLLAGP